MRLTAKLVGIILLEIVILLAIDGYLSFRRELQLFQTDMQRDARLLGHVLSDLLPELWRAAGQQHALQLLDQANREQHRLRIRWVWLDGSADPTHRPLAPMETIRPSAEGQELTTPVTERDGRRFFCTYVPVDVPAERPGAIEIAEPLVQLDSFMYGTAMRNIVLGLVLVTVGSASVVSLGIVLVGRPLHKLADKSRQIGRGDLTPSLEVRGHDELAELARSMNDMCSQLAESLENTRIEQEQRFAAIEQLRQADRLSAVGQLAAGVAHELGTPLNTISIRAGMLANAQATATDVTESVRIIGSQCGRMTSIIRELLAYARPRPPQRALTDLREVARNTITLLAPLATKYNATVTLSESEDACTATADADQIQQVLTNLLVNALQADPEGAPQLEVDVRPKDCPAIAARQSVAQQCICISVRDYGKGISPDDLKHVFDPFFTTKDVGEGTGLGLSVAHGIVQEHGGWIEVSSHPGEGSCFAVFLPVAAKDE